MQTCRACARFDARNRIQDTWDAMGQRNLRRALVVAKFSAKSSGRFLFLDTILASSYQISVTMGASPGSSTFLA